MSGRGSIAALAGIAVLTLAVPAGATTRTWVGPLEGNWQENSHWSPLGWPMQDDDVVLNAQSEEILISFQQPTWPEIGTLTVPATSIHEVGLERWTADWVFMDVSGAVTNHGNLYMENFELVTPQIDNYGSLELVDDMEVEAHIHNRGTLITWEADLEGNVTCTEGALWRLGGWADLWQCDDGTGGNLTNHGRLWFYGSSRLTAEGTLNNGATGTVQGDASSILVFGGVTNEGLVQSYGGDLAVHCDGSAFSNASTGEVTNMAGTTLSILADAMDQRGTITVRSDGAVNLAGSDLVNQPGAAVHLLGGTLSAPNITHQDGAVFEGFGCVDLPADDGGFGTLTNQGEMEFYADTRVVGHLDNQAGAAIIGRNGDLTVVGDLTNNGTITWENGGVYCEGTWTGGVLTLAGDEVKAAGGTLAIAPGGELNVTGSGPANLYADIDCRGALTVGADATATCLGRLSGSMESLTIAGGTTPTGTLDLAENHLIVDYDPAGTNPYDDILAWVASGHNGGTWDGSGITCDGDAGTFALGVADNAHEDFPTRSYLEDETIPVDASSILVRYTLYGNANLDDRVDAADLNKVLINYGEILADPGDIMPWFLGNFNYDDRVDAADLNRVLVNWATLEADVGLGGSPVPLGAAGGSAPMPEPATLALLALGAGAMFRRRRTR